MKKFLQTSLTLFLSAGLVACGSSDTTKLDEQSGEFFSPEQLSEQFLANNFEAIYNQTSSSFKEAVTLAQFKELGSSFNIGVQEYKLVSKVPINEITEFQWISDGGDKGIRSYFAEDYTIEGLQILPVTSFPESDEVLTTNTYQMPINEEWFVFWGGTNELVNYHYSLESQRYAYDLVIYQGDTTYEGDPTDNESYFAFGKDVVAPREGTVIALENNLDDNTPTVSSNPQQPLGNYVILDHDNNEYSIIAHFKKGSLKVSKGDRVEAGELLGSVGNSGNSTEPHIHFHVVDRPEWQEAVSIRIKFEDGADPVRGDRVTGF